MAIGRPTKKRYFSSGEKLLDALKLSGLTWGNNTQLETHISNNKRWLQLRLPKSTNTLVEDIKHGIPQDRLLPYAKFFGVDPRYFVDDTIELRSKEFECEILQKKYALTDSITFPFLEVDRNFCAAFYDQNGKNRNFKLYKYLEGVYISYVKGIEKNEITKCIVKIYIVDDTFLLIDGYLKYYGVDVFLCGVVFKWSTFIHINYYTKNCAVVGYIIAQDPTCSASILYRNPMTLELFGLAGSFASSIVPDRFHGYAEKQIVPKDMPLDAFYHALCDQVAQAPSAEGSTREYEKIFNRFRRIRGEHPAP